ncbi:vacuolar protein sorting-associated protein VTA1 homolog [Symsagittifera roscoffensis]|uniref:vacuolar protein sorting-associated protein VTA1 homolog n=1 Tax=Symsagittifera roscoffensis TaxID=84072 RepID=UPI00307B256A
MSCPEVPKAGDLSPSLRALVPYLNVAVQFDKRDIVVSYYCRMYAMNLGIKTKTDGDKAAKSVLLSLMTYLEYAKNNFGKENEGIANELIAESTIESTAVKLFSAADKLDRAGTANQNVVKMFFTSAKLFEVLTYFKGDVTDYVRAMYKYAAWKATYISSCLKKGETPIPGPASVQGSEEEDELNELLKQLNNAPNPNDPLGPSASPAINNQHPSPATATPPQTHPRKVHPPAGPPPTNCAPNPPRNSSSGGGECSTGKERSAAELEQASKFCKFAQSSLMFNDVDTAVNYLEQALALLKS